MDPEELGLQFAKAIGAEDLEHIREVVHPNIHFRALTPTKYQEAQGDDAVSETIAILAGWFFDDGDDIQEVVDPKVEEMPSHGRYRLTYRLRLKSTSAAEWFREEGWADPADDADWLVDQTGYYDVREGRIARMHMVCSGLHLIAAT